MRSGFSEKYETIGKPLQYKGFIKKLEKNQVVEEKCFSQNSVIRFNSEYMDVLGNWYFFKIAGILAFVILICIGIFTICLCIWGLTLIYSDSETTLKLYILAISCLVTALGMTSVFVFFIRRDFFNYTYYPIRFNRKEKKVYVMQSNKKVSCYDWDDLVVSINNPAKKFFYVRLSILDKNDIIKETFSLPYIANGGLKEGLLGHWEFFRSYMEDETPEKSYHAIKEYYNIHKRKETVSEICYACIMVDRDLEDNLESSEYNSLAIKLSIIWFPIVFFRFFARFVHEHMNRLPPMTGAFIVDEKKYKDDPYNIENKLKDFERTLQLEPKQKLLLWTWGPLSVTLIYLFLELMVYSMKGETLLLGYLF